MTDEKGICVVALAKPEMADAARPMMVAELAREGYTENVRFEGPEEVRDVWGRSTHWDFRALAEKAI